MKTLNRFIVRNTLLALAAVAALFASAASADAARIRIVSLRCISPQERDSNGDELRLKIGSASLRFTGMRAGTVRRINRDFTFFSRVRVTLTEIDNFPSFSPRDEQLGFFIALESEPRGLRSRRFNRHGSNYVLTYQVFPERQFRLQLISLQCVQTQEGGANGDEIRLRVRPDIGGLRQVRLNGMRAGVVRRLSINVRIKSRATVNLTEIDGAGINFRDENLGTSSVPARPSSFGRLRFNRHGAHYLLRYRVVRE